MTRPETAGSVDRRNDWSRRRLFLAFIAFGAFWGAWGAVLPAVQRQAQLSDGRLGAALLGTVAGGLASMRLLAGTLERVGRVAVPLALVAMAGLVVPLAGSRSGVALVGWLAAFGVTSGVLDVAVNAGGSHLEERHGVSVLPVAHGCFSFGLLGGGVLAGVLRQAGVGPQPVLAVVAGLLVAAALVPVRPGVGSAPARRVDSSGQRRLPSLLLLGLLCALSFLVEDALQSWGAVHLEHTFHAPPIVSGLAPALFGLAQGLTRVSAPRWLRGSPLRVISVGGAATSVGLALAAVSPWTWPVLLGLVAAGAGLASVAPLVFGLAAQRRSSTGGSTRSVSVVASVGYLGFVVGPPLTGGVAGVAGLRSAFAMLAAVAAVLGTAAALGSGGGRGGRGGRGARTGQ